MHFLCVTWCLYFHLIQKLSSIVAISPGTLGFVGCSLPCSGNDLSPYSDSPLCPAFAIFLRCRSFPGLLNLVLSFTSL